MLLEINEEPTAFNAGGRAAHKAVRQGVPLEAFISLGEKQARAYVRAYMRREGASERVGVRRAFMYRQAFIIGGIGGWWLVACETHDEALKEKALQFSLLFTNGYV